MASAISANRLELLQIADAVARDKSIDKQVVLTAMEEAMQRAAKAHYGTENDIKVDIDPKTGETHVSRYLHVVELVENDKTEISFADAKKRNPDAQIGDIIAETLPPVDFNRINAQNAKTMTIEEAGSVLPLQLLDAVLSGSIVDPTVTANIEAAAVVLAGEPTQEASHVAAEASSTSEPTPT